MIPTCDDNLFRSKTPSDFRHVRWALTLGWGRWVCWWWRQIGRAWGWLNICVLNARFRGHLPGTLPYRQHWFVRLAQTHGHVLSAGVWAWCCVTLTKMPLISLPLILNTTFENTCLKMHLPFKRHGCQITCTGYGTETGHQSVTMGLTVRLTLIRTEINWHRIGARLWDWYRLTLTPTPSRTRLPITHGIATEWLADALFAEAPQPCEDCEHQKQTSPHCQHGHPRRHHCT